MSNQLTIVSMIYKIDHWSNFEDVKNKMKASLGDTVFSVIDIQNPKSGYVEIKQVEGCLNRVRETIKYEMPLTEFAPIYEDKNGKLFSEFYFIKSKK